MKLTPEQQAAYAAAVENRSGRAGLDDLRMFAAGLAHGIAQERARCIEKCEQRAASLREGAAVARQCAKDIAAIESPTEPPNA